MTHKLNQTHNAAFQRHSGLPTRSWLEEVGFLTYAKPAVGWKYTISLYPSPAVDWKMAFALTSPQSAGKNT